MQRNLNYLNEQNNVVENNKFLSYEERLNNYNKIKAEIFAPEFDKNIDKTNFISRKIERLRLKFKKKKLNFKKVVSSVIMNNDNRPYINVKIYDEVFKGLFDTGANISCLGKDCIKFCERLNIPIKDFVSHIKTASGEQEPVLGYVEIPVVFQNQMKTLTFYLVPTINQNMILGCNFWEAFGLKEKFMGFIEAISSEDLDPNQHVLNAEQSIQLENAINRFKCFSKHGLGKTSLETHLIDTKDSVPIKQKHYPVSPAVQTLLYEELDRMLAMGVIEESNSAWSSPVTLRRKPNKNRLCLDARKLNDVTTKDAYPLPHIEGLLSRLGDTHYISSVDLKDAFWQIPLDPESRTKTAFTVPGRPLYQYTVMPFGLCNAAQRMCRLMDKVIPSRLRERVFVYLDDLLIVSPDFQTHISLIEEVAELLSKANLTINTQKSRFCFKQLEYLGFIVGGGKLKPNPNKVEAISKLKPPRTPKEVRAFLGMTGWYRRFIKDYATIAAPLSDNLRKGPKKFILSEESKIAFEKLKLALISSPVLVTPILIRGSTYSVMPLTMGSGQFFFKKIKMEKNTQLHSTLKN